MNTRGPIGFGMLFSIGEFLDTLGDMQVQFLDPSIFQMLAQNLELVPKHLWNAGEEPFARRPRKKASSGERRCLTTERRD